MGTRPLTMPPQRWRAECSGRMCSTNRSLATALSPASLRDRNHWQNNARDPVGRVFDPDLPRSDAVALELLHAGLRIDREQRIELRGDDEAQSVPREKAI